MAAKNDDGRKTIAENRKARFEFRIEDTWEAGIELTGTEVKSLRTGQANIAESYASAENGGIFLINAYIPEYKGAGHFFQHEPKRPRRLLLHKSEIAKLAIAVERQGMTIVPLELYFNARGKAKPILGVGLWALIAVVAGAGATHRRRQAVQAVKPNGMSVFGLLSFAGALLALVFAGGRRSRNTSHATSGPFRSKAVSTAGCTSPN